MKKNNLLKLNISLLLFFVFACLTACAKTKLAEVTNEYDKSNSGYKHVNNGGIVSKDNLPYNVDAITGATMTVEGAGVYTSIPLSIRELENANAGQVRGIYRDQKGEFSYEGLDLYYLLNNMKEGDNGIKLTNKAYRVILKNSNRESISEFTLDEVENAHAGKRPILLAYGIGDKNGNNIVPFVYDGKDKNTHSLGYVKELSNDDGCIKLVYDMDKYGKSDRKTFSNVAYVYIAEKDEPGYKHTDNTINPLYNDSKYIDYIISIKGSELKNEFTVTVKDIENLVKYDKSGNVEKKCLGYRDSYSMANNAYWYVNSYEGIDLYKYLLYLGMDDAKTMGTKKARTTLVNFVAADGQKSNEVFSIDTLSYNEAFGFYKKNVNDNNDGKYISTNEDLVKLGYPVLLAYGVNNYPYVISKSDEAYVSGLANSGGPFHIIFGKTQYNHPNGSNQIQYVDSIIVGDDILYNTHSYTDDLDIKKYENDILNIEIEDENGNVLLNKEISVNEIENLIYGENVSKQQLSMYKVKNHYEFEKNGKLESDIFEGVDLSNLLLEYVKLNGVSGKITFISDDNQLEVNLGSIFKPGFNTLLKRDNIKTVLAFAKNGKALVEFDNSAGYRDKIDLKPTNNESSVYKVENDGGPLMVLLPSQNKDSYNGQNLKRLKGIKIKLDVDKYSHLYIDKDNLKNNKITFTGKGLEKDAAFMVSEIEKMQTKAIACEYGSDVYKGIPLYDILKYIGIKNNAGDVTVYYDEDKKVTLPLSNIKNTSGNDKVALLAYGKKIDDIETSLDVSMGGPLQLVMPANENVITYNNVTKIEVSANEIKTWSHDMSDVYSEFLEKTFNITIKNDKNEYSHDYTLADIEQMKDYIIRDNYLVLDIGECEGIDIWKVVNRIFNGYDYQDKLVSVTFYAEDGYKNDVLSVVGLNALNTGVEVDGSNKKVLLAYAINSAPLVDNENHEGYTGISKNSDGPMRLVVENVQGASIKQCNKLVITISGEDALELDYNVK